MQISLHSILLHESFDWRCRRSKTALLENMEVVVKEMGKIETMAKESSSSLYRAMEKLYNLLKKPKNVRQGIDNFLKQEDDILKNYILVIQELEVIESGGPEEEKKEEEKKEEEKKEEEKQEEKKEVEKIERGRRKSFKDLKSSTSKRARIDNVINMIKNDPGLESGVVEKLTMEKEETADAPAMEESFKLSCLNAMKTLSLSDTKFDDLRWWIFDLLRRGFDLSKMPSSSTLKAKVKKEMLPPDMASCETGAEFDMTAALFHTGKRFLERPDIRENLKEGDCLRHLAKVGSDFASGFGKIQQVKQGEFDEDGSHNTGFQTLKLSLAEQTLFMNKNPGGSELLRLVRKTTHKDTQEKMVEEMVALDKLCEEIPKQEITIEGVGVVKVEHQLINSLHDGKERLAMTQYKVLNLNILVPISSNSGSLLGPYLQVP